METEGVARGRTMTRARGFNAIPLVVAAVVVVIDQITKALVIRAFGPPEAGKSKEIIPKLLDFRHDENTGAAFSMFQGQSALLLIIAVVVLALLVYYYRAMPQDSWTLRLAVGAVLGGAIGNIIDRIRLGHVTDWIHVTHYPTFNFADSCITVGMITIAATIFFMDRGGRPTNK
jgi:signal peptidase II